MVAVASAVGNEILYEAEPTDGSIFDKVRICSIKSIQCTGVVILNFLPGWFQIDAGRRYS